MLKNVHCSQQTTICTDLGAIFVSMEPSHSKWLITSVLPGNGEKMSRHCIGAGNLAELFALFAKLRERSKGKTGRSYPIISLQESGLDGFWIHRVDRKPCRRPGVNRDIAPSAAGEDRSH